MKLIRSGFLCPKLNIRIALSTLLLAVVFISCRKDIDTSNGYTIETRTNAGKRNFFDKADVSDPLINRVVTEIKRRHELSGFINEFAIKNGFPVWDKTVITTTKRIAANNSIAQNSTNTSTGTDTLLYIPLVIQNETKVNGYILARINDSICLNLYQAKDYKAYPYNAAGNAMTAQKYALQMMQLNSVVFGDSVYTITDSLLFAALHGRADVSRKEIILKHSRNSGTGSTQSLLLLEDFDCYLIQGTYCTCGGGSCDWNQPSYGELGCPDCASIYCIPSAGGGGGGDNGGGTSYPPSGPSGPGGTGGGGGGIQYRPRILVTPIYHKLYCLGNHCQLVQSLRRGRGGCRLFMTLQLHHLPGHLPETMEQLSLIPIQWKNPILF